MKNLLLAACGMAAILAVSGCYAGPGRAGYRTGYTHGPYDAYYDGHYGPYSSGYWANDGFSYYSDGRRYHRDNGRHFRRDRFDGGVVVRGTVRR